MMINTRIISQKTVFKSKLFEVKENTLKVPSGKTIRHEDIYRDPTIHVFPITEEYEIYLISEYRYLHKRVVLDAVAGFIDKGESALHAARRELKEEAGITAHQIEQLTELYLGGSVILGKVHVFLAKDLEVGEQNLEEDEQIQVVKMPLSQAAQKVAQGEVQCAAAAAGILLLDKLRREKKL